MKIVPGILKLVHNIILAITGTLKTGGENKNGSLRITQNFITHSELAVPSEHTQGLLLVEVQDTGYISGRKGAVIHVGRSLFNSLR
jgi:hypothetical protein